MNTTRTLSSNFESLLDDTNFLTEIAILYYQQNATQEEISKNSVSAVRKSVVYSAELARKALLKSV